MNSGSWPSLGPAQGSSAPRSCIFLPVESSLSWPVELPALFLAILSGLLWRLQPTVASVLRFSASTETQDGTGPSCLSPLSLKSAITDIYPFLKLNKVPHFWSPGVQGAPASRKNWEQSPAPHFLACGPHRYFRAGCSPVPQPLEHSPPWLGSSSSSS